MRSLPIVSIQSCESKHVGHDAAVDVNVGVLNGRHHFCFGVQGTRGEQLWYFRALNAFEQRIMSRV